MCSCIGVLLLDFFFSVLVCVCMYARLPMCIFVCVHAYVYMVYMRICGVYVRVCCLIACAIPAQ